MARRVGNTPTNKEIYNKLEEQDVRLDRLEVRINYLFGGLAVLITIANIVGPEILKALIK